MAHNIHAWRSALSWLQKFSEVKIDCSRKCILIAWIIFSFFLGGWGGKKRDWINFCMTQQENNILSSWSVSIFCSAVWNTHAGWQLGDYGTELWKCSELVRIIEIIYTCRSCILKYPCFRHLWRANEFLMHEQPFLWDTSKEKCHSGH